MSTNMDLAALMNSEVMRIYLQNEITKTAAKENLSTIEEPEVVDGFIDFENKIKQNPKMLFAFQQLQKKFASDQIYVESCNPLFVQAVMMLDINEQE